MSSFQTSSYFARFLLSSIRKYCRECKIKSLEGSGCRVQEGEDSNSNSKSTSKPHGCGGREDLSGFGVGVSMEVDLVGRQAL